MALWGDWPVPPLDRLLRAVKDQTPLPTPDDAPDEYRAYCEVVALAAAAAPEALEEKAAANPNVVFAHLHNDPRYYRGKVVRVEGILTQVSERDVPDVLRARGVAHLYDGWIFGKTPGINPYFVTFTELPRTIKVGRGDADRYKVAFDGYFFKKLVYQAQKDKGKAGRYSPMLIGRTVVLRDKPPKRSQVAAANVEEEDQFKDLAPDLRKLKGLAEDLRDVLDRRAIPRDVARNPGEFTAWCETVLVASKTSREAFSASARKNAAISYDQLMNEPGKHRGFVISVKGHLKRLRATETPAYLQARGVSRVYEGWIRGAGRHNGLYCVIFTRLPAGVVVEEEIDYPVTFDGYFFKQYGYEASRERRLVPYLIGRTIVLKDSASRALAGSYSTFLIVGIYVLLGGTVLVVVGLGWWLRRADRGTRLRLREASMEPGFDGGESGTDSPDTLAVPLPEADVLRNGH
jgi:hypothetical protein